MLVRDFLNNFTDSMGGTVIIVRENGGEFDLRCGFNRIDKTSKMWEDFMTIIGYRHIINWNVYDGGSVTDPYIYINIIVEKSN